MNKMEAIIKGLRKGKGHGNYWKIKSNKQVEHGMKTRAIQGL